MPHGHLFHGKPTQCGSHSHLPLVYSSMYGSAVAKSIAASGRHHLRPVPRRCGQLSKSTNINLHCCAYIAVVYTRNSLVISQAPMCSRWTCPWYGQSISVTYPGLVTSLHRRSEAVPTFPRSTIHQTTTTHYDVICLFCIIMINIYVPICPIMIKYLCPIMIKCLCPNMSQKHLITGA